MYTPVLESKGLWGLAGLCVLAGLAFGVPAPDTEQTDLFESRIRPILVESCFKCHGPGKQKSGLRLDSLAGMRTGGERGAALIPGSPEQSLLMEAIGWGNPDLQMPPRTRLSNETVQDFGDWIAAGAVVPDDFKQAAPGPASDSPASIPVAFDLDQRLEHWSFRPIRDVTPPVVKHPELVNNPIDAFVQARLEQQGLTPNLPADRYTLLRRVTFDLTGLPPSMEEIDSFINDNSPGAYQRVVDRLLGSPAYGEHWARQWLDLMRYAESRGHEFDYNIPNAWQYRDYVIRAYQDDVPYDRFVLEHLAGDLLTEPRPNRDAGWDESILGTGSWFLGEEVHSPVDIRGDQVERVANQVDVVTKAFLGLTVACARCHDHKFDAIPTQDFYAMSGFALSSSQRQVRFESRQANATVARDLAREEARYAPAIAQAYGDAWAESAAEVAQLLAIARKVALADPDDYPELPVTQPESEDILLEDFEGDTWGAWEVEGDAFGESPAQVAAAPDSMGELNARGRGLANSYIPGRTDARRGSLTGPAFEINRRYVRFLLGGGDHLDTTGVQLWLQNPDGTWMLAITRTGTDSNRLVSEVFDLRAWQGRTARIRIFDDAVGAWGQIAIDHLVLSDNAEEEATREAKALKQRRALYLSQLCEQDDLELPRGRAALDLVDAARDHPTDPLQGLFDDVPPDAALGHQDNRGVPMVLMDWGALGTNRTQDPAWFVDGPTFGVAPRRTGELLLGAVPWRPLARVVSLPGPHADPAWDGLALAPGTEVLRTKIDWIQSGRTFKTATFVTPELPLWYLIEGACDVFVEVDGHRLLEGPLHGVLVEHCEESGLRWVRQDTTDYAGERAHIEFTPRTLTSSGATSFALHAVVASANEPDLPLDASYPRHVFQALTDTTGGVARLATELRTTAEALAKGKLSPVAARLADWMARHPNLLPARYLEQGRFDTSMGLAFQAWFDARAQVTRSARMQSHTALAMFEGSPVDEHVLIRGSYRTPGDLAPRRAPIGVAGSDQTPMPQEGGRLVLARRILAPENPFLARVHVNRVWHHLFGRGLVPTVDNLGLLGERPTHPDLLDWLSTWTREEGWSTKNLVRLIVSSQAYQRSSKQRPDLDAIDPGNSTWFRTFVRRLTGEELRDAMLAISGDLDPTPFGPPVPVHLDEFLEGRGRPQKSGPIDGDRRRSIYLAVRRNFLQPFFRVFDQPKPTTTVGRRSNSNVPAQALALMNDPFVHQEAKAWAQHTGVDSGADSGVGQEGRLERMFLECYGRPIQSQERQEVQQFLEREQARWRREEGDPELWENVAHVLLSSTEVMFLR